MPSKSPSEIDYTKVEKVYSIYSKFYDLVYGKLFYDSRTAAIQLLEIKPGDRILEVGVGTGLSLPSYPRDCLVLGFDLTGAMLEKGIERVQRWGLHNVHLQQMDAAHMAFSQNSFDAVMAAYVMTAVPEPHRVLSEMCRVCRPGGRIVFLNHFTNGNPFVHRMERTVSPLCTRIGFRTDLAVEELLEGSPLIIQKRLKANPFRFWEIVQCINQKV